MRLAGNSLRLRFSSDNSISGDGFMISYQVVSDRTVNNVDNNQNNNNDRTGGESIRIKLEKNEHPFAGLQTCC